MLISLNTIVAIAFASCLSYSSLVNSYVVDQRSTNDDDDSSDSNEKNEPAHCER